MRLTQVVDAVLADVRNEYPADAGQPFLIIKLDGNVHTTDRLALQSMVVQLQLPKLVLELSSNSNSNSIDFEDAENEPTLALSFADALALILDTLKTGSSNTTPIILVLDNLDKFAGHDKQLLLYNLFDLCQSGSTPMAVVGTTRRLDAIEMFEKRVKSRFSHRTLHFYPRATQESVDQVCKAYLDLECAPGVDADYCTAFSSNVDVCIALI